MSLQIFTLGTLSIEMDGKPLAKLPSRAAEALLVYVACQPQPVSRDTLATLLWEGRTQQNARGNLRTVLSGLRQAVGDYLIVTRHEVAFNHTADYRLDCAEFEALLAAFAETGDIDTLQRAMNLYRGDFLAGFSLRDGLGFEEWALLTQESLRRRANNGLRRLVEYHFQRGEYEISLERIKYLLTIAPFDEKMQRRRMESLLRLGQRNAAIKSYREYRQLHFEQLGTAPDAATQALFTRIKNAEIPPVRRIPVLSAPFIGRESELTAIFRCFANPNCRLISILGPGGIGKTSIAVQAAHRLAQTQPGQFLDGIYFVPLTNLETTSLLPCKMADTLNFKLMGLETVEAQLLDFLRDKELLLILDNFEHLILPESVAWLSQILNAAPNVKILLTSRERLNLPQEYTIDLRGLPYPAAAIPNAESFGAVKLFLQHANRVQYNFDPDADELAAIIRFCQLVDGMPLAIELAAAEMRYFPCRHIVSEIEKKLDFQSAPAANRPPRHASLRATIEYSWALLAENEPILHIARRLAVFHGAFDLPAAIAVTKATPHQLISLVDRSFLYRTQTGAFEIHPLIHHFLAEKLAEHPTEEKETRLRHADWYTKLIKSAAGFEHENMERHFSEMKDAAKTHLDNIIAAALYLARYHHFPNRRLVTLIESLIFYFDYSHRYREWKSIFRQIIAALQEESDGGDEERWLILVLSSRIVQADISLHAYSRAEAQLRAMMPAVYALQNDALISACLEMQSILSARAGNFAEAFRQAEAALAAVAGHDNHYQWSVLRTLGDIAFDAGDLARAEAAHRRAFTLAAESASETEALPVFKLAMGKIARRRGRLNEAYQLLNEALTAARHGGVPERTIACLTELGWTTTAMGNYNAADAVLTEAASLAEAQGNLRLIALAFLARANLAATCDGRAAAQEFYRRSADIFRKIGDKPNLALVPTEFI